MASLNTLRTKYGIVLTVAIAIVLAAFVLDPQSLFQSGQKAADNVELTINGKEIRTKEYQEAYQTVGFEQDVEGYLVYEHFFAPELKALGLTSADEVTMKKVVAQDMLDRKMSADQIRTQLNSLTPAQLRIAYAESVAKKAAMEGFHYNVADLEQLERMGKVSFSGRYVEYPYSTVADAEVTVTEEEVKAYYDAHLLHNPMLGARSIVYAEFPMTAEEGAEVDMREVTARVDAFMESAMADAEAFKNAAIEAGVVSNSGTVSMSQLNNSLQMANFMISQLDPMSENYAEQSINIANQYSPYGSYDLNVWALGTGKGAISRFTVADKIIVAMVEDVDEDQYIPFENREQDIRVKLMNDKKYEIIAASMTGLDSKKAQKFADVKFDNKEYDAHLVGAICATQTEGEEIKVKGENAAYLVRVETIKGADLGDVESQRIAHTETGKANNAMTAIAAFESNLKVENPRQK